MATTTPPYLAQNAEFGKGKANNPEQVKALQRDLRRLGYLRTHIDGKFGDGTEAAVKALQIDLAQNDGIGSDKSRAPVAVRDYNVSGAMITDGIVRQSLVQSIILMLDDERFPKLPSSDRPAAENARVASILKALPALDVPLPFLLAIFEQESNMQHFRVPTGANDDNFVLVGLDRNDKTAPDRITSRGFGIGQYTFFHHPLTQSEIDSYVMDIEKNVEHAIKELHTKYLKWVVGPLGEADDHAAEFLREHETRQLRPCKYDSDDPRYMADCRQCLAEAPRRTIESGSAYYTGAKNTLQTTQYHRETQYRDVPDRSALACDWPYAVRRYNGAGVNSYHYQAKILLRVLAGVPSGDKLNAATTRG